MSEFLTTLGLPVHAFTSAEEFLSQYDAAWTGIAFVDQRLPGIQGEELVTELARRQSRLRAVLMTGEPGEQFRRKGIEAGALGVLEKPFRAQQMIDLMKSHCPELFTS